MSINMTQRDFRALGLSINPDDQTQAISVETQFELIPGDCWDLNRLGTYAATGLNEANRLLRESVQLGHRSTVQIFRSGRACQSPGGRSKPRSGVNGGGGSKSTISRGPLRGRQSSFTSGLAQRKRSRSWRHQRQRSGMESANRRDQTLRDRWILGATARQHVRSTHHSDSTSPSEDESNDGGPEDAELEPNDEPDLLVRPPRTLRAMLVLQVTFCCRVRSAQVRLTPRVATSSPRSVPVFSICKEKSCRDQQNHPL